jgi:hypothetical protein
MTKLPYQQVFERIRAEFLEMPGMRLTTQQLERQVGVDRTICQTVVEESRSCTVPLHLSGRDVWQAVGRLHRTRTPFKGFDAQRSSRLARRIARRTTSSMTILDDVSGPSTWRLRRFAFMTRRLGFDLMTAE